MIGQVLYGRIKKLCRNNQGNHAQYANPFRPADPEYETGRNDNKGDKTMNSQIQFTIKGREEAPECKTK